MDFQRLKRRDLQTLCKKNNIPANTTNAAMADALALLPTVEGLEDFLEKPETEAQGSPERSVITSPDVPRTTTRRKALKEELESSKLATRTRGGTSRTRAVEGTNTRKTTVTRTTQRRACQAASVMKEMEKDLQAEFDADVEQSEVSENSVLGGELQEISEEVSQVSVENEGELSSGSQSEAQNELQQANDGQEVIDLDDFIVNEAQKEPSESKKVDFHSFTRKDLQILCKKNKIPANKTNAAMADALASLEIVEGLEEFVKDYDSEALSSPIVSGISKSCARHSRTTLKTTKEEPLSSKLITKSCRSSRRRIVEETELTKNDVPEISAAQTPSGFTLCETESIQEKGNIAVPKSELKKLEISSMDDGECPTVEEPLSSKLITESCHGSRKRIVEETEQTKNDDSEISAAVPKSELKKLEISSMDDGECLSDFSNFEDEIEGLESSEVISVGKFNSMFNKSLMQEAPVNESTFEDADRKGNDNVLSVEPEGLVSKVNENVVEESSEDAEAFTVVEPQLVASCAIQLEIAADGESDDPQPKNLAKATPFAAEDEISKEFVSESATRVDQLLYLETVEESNDSKVENVANAPDLPGKDQISKDFVCESENNKLEKVASVTFSSPVQIIPVDLEEDELSQKSYSMSTAQADKISLESRGKIESDNNCTEDDMSENYDDSDSESDSDSYNSCTEDEMSAETDIKTTAQADNKHLEINGISESDGSDTEDNMSENSDDSDSESEGKYTKKEMSEKSDIEAIIQADTILEINMECESEGSCKEGENFDSKSISQEDQEIIVDTESERNQLEKLDNASDSATNILAEDHISSKLDIVPTTEAICAPSEKLEVATQAGLCAPTKKDKTPLEAKSLRQLKRMLKENLQAMTKSMENLNLEDTEKPLLKVEEASQGLTLKVSEDIQEPEEESNNDLQENLKDEALSNDQINLSSENEAIDSGVNTTTLCPIDILVDYEVIPEDAITGDINVVACPPQQTPSKLATKTLKQPLLFMSPSKKPMSTGRKNRVLDVDKENVGSKTELVKLKVATTESEKLLSMSMGMLKKEVKVLQSEKKRPALQSRSENNCILTSP